MSEKNHILFFIIITSVLWNCRQINAAEYIDLSDQNKNNNQRCTNNFPSITSPSRDKNGFLPLDLAAAQGDDIVVASLINNGARLYQDEQGGTAFHWAARRGNLNSLKLLWKAYKSAFERNQKGLDDLKDNNGLTPLCYAAMGGKDRNLFSNESSYLPTQQSLTRPSSENYTAIINLLLDAGAQINNRNDKKNTPFYIACKFENIDIIRLLLRRNNELIKDPLNRALIIELKNPQTTEEMRLLENKEKCGCCFKEPRDKRSFECNRCKLAFYCSRDCQQGDLSYHRSFCSDINKLIDTSVVHRIKIDNRWYSHHSLESLYKQFPNFRAPHRTNEP